MPIAYARGGRYPAGGCRLGCRQGRQGVIGGQSLVFNTWPPTTVMTAPQAPADITRRVNQSKATAMRRAPAAAQIVLPEDPPSGVKTTHAALNALPAGSTNRSAAIDRKRIFCRSDRRPVILSDCLDRANRKTDASALLSLRYRDRRCARGDEQHQGGSHCHNDDRHDHSDQSKIRFARHGRPLLHIAHNEAVAGNPHL